MYGLAKGIFVDCLTTNYGLQTWSAVRDRLRLIDDPFRNMETYDDQFALDLVAAAAAVTGVDTDTLLKQWGRHWVLSMAKSDWAPVLAMGGRTVAELLSNLNRIHLRIGSTMPTAHLPTFLVHEADATTIYVEYLSIREGLTPLAFGALVGLTEVLDDPYEVHMIEALSEAVNTRQSFRLDKVDVPKHQPVSSGQL